MENLTPIEDFGEALVKTRDLDPVYCAIHGANLGVEQTSRLLLAYWCFYDLGVASFMSEKRSDYWQWMKIAAANEQPKPGGGRWPRQPERRHFRGPKCVAAVDYLSRRAPEDWVGDLRACSTEKQVMEAIQRWPMFGPWIGFKAADMLERCLGAPIQFSENIGLIYSEPRACLDILSDQRGISQQRQYGLLLEQLRNYKAPPGHDRCCGPQEVETVLCKWKSHSHGGYSVGKDIREVRRSLALWDNDSARRLLQACPQEVGELTSAYHGAVRHVRHTLSTRNDAGL